MKINFDKVSFTYPGPVLALEGVSLAIESGEFVAIVGENGAGKTTLVKMLNGLLRPIHGQVMVGDWDVADHTTAELARRVGFLFQNPDDQLFERSVRREVSFGPRNLGFSSKKIAANTQTSLKSVSLTKKADENPYDLEPFERKLLALAATLAQETPVLVLDEPSIGQDEKGKRRIGGILQDLRKKGRTILLISHDLDFCAENAERVIVMADGHILEDGPAETVFGKTETLKRAALIPPQLVRLAKALKMPSAPLTIPRFVAAYAKRRNERNKK